MDQHLTPEIGTGLFYSAEQAPDRQEFLDLVLERLRRVRTSTVKRVREREFSVWHGRFTTTLGDDLVGLLLPDPIDIRVYRSPEEHAWRILTPLFRETAARPMGWSGYDEMRAMASRDLAELRERPAATLFERMLRAVIVRIDGGETALTETVSDGMQSIIDEMEHLAAQMFQADLESVRAIVRATLGDESEPTPWDPAAGSFDVVPPVVPDPSGLHRFIALEPAPGNPRGDDAGGWIDHHAPHRPAGSLRKWRALAPEDVALRIYRPLP